MKNTNLLTFGTLVVASAVWWACGTSSEPTPFSQRGYDGFPEVAVYFIQLDSPQK